MRTGADALVAALEAHGVEIVFGIPGQHALSLWEALRGSSIRPVVVRHEQAAAFAAVGYARTSDRLGVCITSTGPGAFNAFAGMGEADASNLRVLHITTQVPSDAGERGWMHETVGQSSAFAAVTRHHLRPRTPAALAAAVDEALCAIACRPGPAMIEADDHRADRPRRTCRDRGHALSPPAPDPAAVGRVRELLDGAQAPLVFAGGGARLHAAPRRRAGRGAGRARSSPASTARACCRPATRCTPDPPARSPPCAAWSPPATSASPSAPASRRSRPATGRSRSRARSCRSTSTRPASAATTPCARESSPTSGASAMPCSRPASPPAPATAPPHARAALAGRAVRGGRPRLRAGAELMRQLDAALPDDRAGDRRHDHPVATGACSTWTPGAPAASPTR